MAKGSPATVTMAMTLASAPSVMSSVYVFRVIHAVVTSVKCECVTLSDYIRVCMSAVSPATGAD